MHCASVSAARRIMQHQGQSPHYNAMPGPSFRQQAPDPRSTRPFGAGPSQPPRFSGPAQEEGQARRGNVFQKVRPLGPFAAPLHPVCPTACEAVGLG